MRRILIAGILGGIVLFVWNSVSWMALPWHAIDMHNVPDAVVPAGAPFSEMREAGVYHFPGLPPSKEMSEEWMNKARTGPAIPFMIYRPDGYDPMAPATFIRSIVFNIFSAMILAYLMTLALPNLPGAGAKIRFGLLVGVFIALAVDFMNWNWWFHPTGFTLVNAADHVISFGLVGAVMAWRLK